MGYGGSCVGYLGSLGARRSGRSGMVGGRHEGEGAVWQQTGGGWKEKKTTRMASAQIFCCGVLPRKGGSKR